jgi:hypothetical protein
MTTALRPRLLILILLAAVALVLAFSARRLGAAQLRCEAALGALEQLRLDAAEVQRLRARREVVAWRQRPAEDVLALVNAALAEAGIPTAHLQGIGDAADAALSAGREEGPALRRQSLTVRLERLSAAQVGAFLEQWHALQDHWTGSRLELTHRRDQRRFEHFDLRLHISAVYLAGQ